MEGQLHLFHIPPISSDIEIDKQKSPNHKRKVNNQKSIVSSEPGACQSSLILIPTISIHPNQVNFYHEVYWENGRKIKYDDSGNEVKHERKVDHLLKSDRTPNGIISPIAKRKIVKAIDYLLLFASDKKVTSQRTGRAFNFKIAFITLTLPSQQIHTDNEIKRTCLNSFIIELQKYHKVKYFLWRAEKQKNGNIHFHIITDKFIHWNDVRNRWNRIINKLGYVDRYRDNMKKFFSNGFQVREDLKHNWSELKQRRAYEANLKSDFHNPNSTDIHSIQKIRNLTTYFVKYLTKNEKIPSDSESIENIQELQKGRIWGASRNLQNITGAKIILDSEMQQELEEIISNSDCKAYHSDYYSVFYINFRKLRTNSTTSLFEQFSDYLITEFGYHCQLEIT